MNLRPSRYFVVIAGSAFLAASIVSIAAADRNEKKSDLRKVLAAKYPGLAMVNFCNGSFLGQKGAMAAAFYDQQKKLFRIVWVMEGGSDARGGIQELESVPQFGSDLTFELQCLNGAQAKDIAASLAASEGIHNFLKVPDGAGALCYFTDATTTHCWTAENVRIGGATKKGKAKLPARLIDAGGWQT